MRLCRLKPLNPQKSRCEVCGVTYPVSAASGKAVCRGNRQGDLVERLLQSIGVTEEKYKEAKQLFGLPASCNCAGRKQWLNKVSDWWRDQTS